MMLFYKEYKKQKYRLINKKIDTTIYTLDIETTSYLILNDKIMNSDDYINLNEKEKEESIKQSCMYIWAVGVNDVIYYGRTYDELIDFLNILEFNIPEKKIFFIHNLSFEFQFLKQIFNFELVFAREKRKVMKLILQNYNIEMRCSLYLSNCKLEKLSEIYELPVKKLVGNLDYNKIRHSNTYITKKEMDYLENDCLVLYYFIKKMLEKYKQIHKIPLTSTGIVRRELREKVVYKNYFYRNKVKKSINIEPHIFNLLNESFSGGYTHANWIHCGKILKNVYSFDFASEYPFCMISEKYPMTEFKKCIINNISDMSKRFAYILVVKFYKIKSKYYNNFISTSKCRKIVNGVYDNGRLIKADEIEIVINDVDFYFLLKSHKIEKYEILESYFSKYKYLDRNFIMFILQKYVIKTKYKGIEEKKTEYMMEKNKFNSLYGMCVTKTISDKVIYDNKLKDFDIKKLNNNEIEELLKKEKEAGFLNFAWGCWVTSYARRNLLENLIKLDKYVIYSDTDSLKLLEGFDINIINDYNKKVIEKLKKISEFYDISFEYFEPKDVKGKKRLIGIFEDETKEKPYDEFITLGAKKYGLIENDEIKITISGVPKKGSKQLKSLEDFKEDLIFLPKYTGKKMLVYNDNQVEIELIDYKGKKFLVKDKTGVAIFPCEYKLKESLFYKDFEESVERGVYIE